MISVLQKPAMFDGKTVSRPIFLVISKNEPMEQNMENASIIKFLAVNLKGDTVTAPKTISEVKIVRILTN